MSTDVLPRTTHTLVVGGGIAGVSAAYHLAQLGVAVVLVDQDRIGGGVTANALGVLAPPLRFRYRDFLRIVGAKALRDFWDFGLRSVEGLADLMEERGLARAVDLDRSGGHVLAEEHNRSGVERDFKLMAEAGLPVRWMDRPELRACTESDAFGGGFRVTGGGAVNPAAATLEFGRAAVEEGALIVEATRVLEVRRQHGAFRVQTDRGAISCSAVVHATNLEGMAALRAMGLETVGVRVQAFRTGPVAMRFPGFFVTEGRTNVWRQRADGRLMVTGWRDYAIPRAYGREQGEVDGSLQSDIRAWFESSFPALGMLEIEAQWSASITWTPDFLPVVGALPSRPGEWVVAGLGDGGFSLAFEAGRSVAHGIAGEHPVRGAELIDPARLVPDGLNTVA